MPQEKKKTIWWGVDGKKTCVWCIKEMLDTRAMTIYQLGDRNRLMGLCHGHEPCERCGKPFRRGDYKGEAERVTEKMMFALQLNRGMDELQQGGEHEPRKATQ